MGNSGLATTHSVESRGLFKEVSGGFMSAYVILWLLLIHYFDILCL